jgi:hypothetical protein
MFLGDERNRSVSLAALPHLRADCLDNVESLKSLNLIGLHGLIGA